ncbi:MAG: AMP-binding protein [Solirubrobacteraceae bacterium]
MFVSTLLARAAARWPERTAVVDGDIRLTYRELAARVLRLANGLAGLGLEPGDRVLDLQRNGHTYVETDLACAVAGVVRVPVNVRLTPAEWSYIAANAGARGLVYGEEFEDAVGELLDLPGLKVCVGIGGGGPGWDYEDLLSRSSATAPSHREAPDDIVSLNYSSGTTGKPKGCIRTAANRHASTVDTLLSIYEGTLAGDDVFLHAGPLTHASGLFVLPHIAVGATQLILRRFDAEEVRGTLESSRVTATVLVPTMLERLLATFGGEEPPRLPALRRLAYAGAPMPPDRIARAHDLLAGRLVQFYGLVEAIPPLTVLSPADHDVEHLRASAGRPVLGAALDVVDEAGRSLPLRQPGELMVGGLHVMDGYWADEEATVKSVRDGWLHTGDIAWLGEDGYVRLVDRKADMIITGGFNVMPREVELVLGEADGVAEVAVVGLPDPAWGEAVTAFVVPAAGATLDSSGLLEHCAARLSGFKKPKRIEIVSDLPRASTGKVSRSALRAIGGQARNR